jgi:2-polyprenyl-3-methyl-5-hydroxy-6-metoxy-1,4-benzoquinol methylase
MRHWREENKALPAKNLALGTGNAATKANRYMEHHYPETRFGGFTRIDGTIAFFTRVNALLHPDFTVLDVGCGRGEYAEDANVYRRNLRILKGKVQRVIGIDVEQTGQENPCIDEFRLIEGERWPVEDKIADMIVCDSVVEHLPNPDAFFEECRRALKLGGSLCLRTPNTRSYFGLVSRLIPNRLHTTALSQVKDRRKEEDVFPTLYRCNTRGRLRRALERHGFKACVYGYEAEPTYLSFNGLAYWLGTLHAKLAPQVFQLVLFGFARKVR